MKVIFDKEKQKLPIYSWCEEPQEGAIEQAVNLSNLPFLFKHVSLMPDTHQGYGMPIGGVIATKGVIIPNAVGVDIGCGMRAFKTSITELNTDTLKTLMGAIREAIPVGFEHHKEKSAWRGFDIAPNIAVIQRELESAKYQVGTLGGGNHFIEIQKDEEGRVWVMIHSGSRNFGLKIAKEYNQKAQELCKKWYSNIPEFKGEDGLAFLPIDTEEGKEYIEAMNFALMFAQCNRATMMYNIIGCMEKLGLKAYAEDDHDILDVHHNYARLENHLGHNVWVHRKGATSARKDEKGIIPGSQGTASYIVKGLGNRDSFESCSHGAGRKMGRNEARKSLDLEEEKRKLDEQGIVHSVRNISDLDEAAGAYKDIDVVMEEQKDLVKVVVKLTPLGVIKG